MADGTFISGTFLNSLSESVGWSLFGWGFSEFVWQVFLS